MVNRLPVMNVVMTFPPCLHDGPQQLVDFACNPPLIWIGSAAREEQIVVAWAAGDHARDLLALPEQAQFERALTSVRTITGSFRAKYTFAASHSWTDDQFGLSALDWQHPVIAPGIRQAAE